VCALSACNSTQERLGIIQPARYRRAYATCTALDLSAQLPPTAVRQITPTHTLIRYIEASRQLTMKQKAELGVNQIMLNLLHQKVDSCHTCCFYLRPLISRHLYFVLSFGGFRSAHPPHLHVPFFYCFCIHYHF
jgi:hypothetical protein